MNVALPVLPGEDQSSMGSLGACCLLRQSCGCCLQTGAVQYVAHIQLLPFYFPTVLLADEERWRAAGVARGTAVTPVRLPSIAALD